MTLPRGVRALAMAAAAILAMAQLPSAWSHWRFLAPIEAGSTDSPRYASLTIPGSVMTHAAPGLVDLRLIDADGREVPYALSARLGGRVADRRDATLLEPSVVPKEYSQAIFDLGQRARVHNAVTLSIEGTDDVLTWVEIAVSDDHTRWRVVRERAPIYRLLQSGLDARMSVSYPESLARYLRVRILDGSRPYKITAGQVSHEVVTEAERVPAGIPLTSGAGADGTTVWTADAPAVPLVEVRFETGQTAFYRPVSVEVSDDGTNWMRAGSGEIWKTVEAGQPRESLAVGFPERSAPHWRVTVFNRNDAPLADTRAAFSMTPRHLIFRQEPAGAYRLVYGNSRIGAPQYDLVRLIDQAAIASAAPVTLDAEAENAGYSNPAPWTEQHPLLLWVALGVAILVLGGLAIRTMKG